MTDPRAAVEYRVPANDLRKGDLVNTTPGEDDWQEVVGVYRKADDAKSTEIRTLVSTLGGRYVVVQLTDLAPVDGGIFFDEGAAMIYGDDEGEDQAVADVISGSDGVRTYLYTKFELVTVRAKST
ncbi:MAG: hypothetical protein JWR06_522 [Jatrophihabitans sp.]|nr:hypothetical protein [Jatrophihabitans sp.]MCW2656329.1 hypothetical protein [Jatrophihabitans sp.]MDT4903287.1 hypothetical protein [Pseudonocardiales bacterium]MDT4928574.1 hypothetical protein [Pseudonocardiales bacterium]MDT4948008.1 hypothetical protein [Pseudonocardiales bacterium]